MPSPFGAQALSLGQLLADPNFIHVPSYQRSFAWTRAEASQLLDDVSEAFEADGIAGQSSDYFLGSMLFIEPDPPAGRIAAWKAARAGRTHDVVDGLQRLTTLAILFCVLRDLDDIVGDAPTDGLLAAIGSGARPRLAMREPEEAFFQAYVRRPGATGTQPQDGTLSLSEGHILDVREHMRETLAEWDPAQRQRLAGFLLDKCHIVMVSATGIDRAHRMFTVLNTAGRQLARNDILKAALLGAVPVPARDRATATWDAAQARLGADFDSLFSHLRTIHRRNATPIIAGIQDLASEEGGAEAFIMRLLGPASEAFDHIRSARHSGSPHSGAIATSLRYLNWLRGGDWIPPALLYWMERGNDAAELAWFLRELDRMAYGLRLAGMGTKRRSARLSHLMNAVRSGADLKGPGSPLLLSRDDQSTIRHNLRDLHARSAPMAKLVLLRLNEQMGGGPQDLPFDELTVEHLLPRKPSTSSRWREWYADPLERSQCTESLGNLVLMTKAQNDKAGNLEFARKQEVLFPSGGTALRLPINEYVRSQSEWRAAQVLEREAELLRLISRMWDIAMPAQRTDSAAKSPPRRRSVPEARA